VVHRLRPEDAVLVIVDWQERLFRVMDESRRSEALHHCTNLYWLAQEMALPVVVSEQYPKGLGPTVLQLRVDDPIEKVTFSAVATDGFRERLKGTDRKQILLTGMETHICVAQTCRDLVEAGYEVWVVADACLSRRPFDWEIGVERMRRDGAIVTTAEAAGFELLGSAKHPQFRGFSKRIK
jgi:isochorismate hydrolase